MGKSKICVFGQDKRMQYLCKLLNQYGYEAIPISSPEEVGACYFDHYVFPVGTDQEFLERFINNNPNSIFFVGNCSVSAPNVFDYFKDEVVTIKNTIPTAEGAIATAIYETEITLFGSQCLVLGYGKVAKTLAGYLGCFGSKVTVAARKERDRALAKICMFETIDICELEEKIENFDIIINTIPAKIINSDILLKIKDDALIIDLASKPGGVDFKEAEKLGKKVIWALGLPAKVAPKTAARYIFEYIKGIIEEREK